MYVRITRRSIIFLLKEQINNLSISLSLSSPVFPYCYALPSLLSSMKCIKSMQPPILVYSHLKSTDNDYARTHPHPPAAPVLATGASFGCSDFDVVVVVDVGAVVVFVPAAVDAAVVDPAGLIDAAVAVAVVGVVVAAVLVICGAADEDGCDDADEDGCDDVVTAAAVVVVAVVVADVAGGCFAVAAASEDDDDDDDDGAITVAFPGGLSVAVADVLPLPSPSPAVVTLAPTSSPTPPPTPAPAAEPIMDAAIAL